MYVPWQTHTHTPTHPSTHQHTPTHPHIVGQKNIFELLIITHHEFSINSHKLNCNYKLCAHVITFEMWKPQIIRNTINFGSLQTQTFNYTSKPWLPEHSSEYVHVCTVEPCLSGTTGTSIKPWLPEHSSVVYGCTYVQSNTAYPELRAPQ